MSISIMDLCWPLSMPPTAKSVLISLADNANDEGRCWPSIPTICERTCLGRTAVIRALKWLEDSGAIVANRDRRSNSYVLTPTAYRGDVSGDYHYVYKITHEPTGVFYIGLRHSYCAPESDNYWGSGRACEWLYSVREECTRDILSTHDSRQEAAERESALLSENVGSGKCLNRVISNPQTAMNNPPGDLKNSPSREPSVSRTVRLANGNRSTSRTDTSAKGTSLVRETNPNRKEPSLKATVKATVIAPEVAVLLAGIPAELVTDFLKLRKAKHAPLTVTAIKGICREAEKAGVTLEQAIDTCCQRGWAGFKAEWVARDGPTKPLRPDGKPSAAADFRNTTYTGTPYDDIPPDLR